MDWHPKFFSKVAFSTFIFEYVNLMNRLKRDDLKLAMFPLTGVGRLDELKRKKKLLGDYV